MSLSHLLSCCSSRVFLDFPEFWHGARNNYEVLHEVFGKTFFAPEIGKNGPKIGFFEFKEKFSY